MLVQAATALLLFFHHPKGVPPAALAGLALVAVIWLSTALLQGPRHTTLGFGLDTESRK